MAFTDPDLLTGRLFFAVAVPPPTRAPLEALLPDLTRTLPDARVPIPSGWHVTCAFLGKVRAEHAADVAAVGETAAASGRPLTLRLEGAGGFPDTDEARTLWAGLAGEVDVLADIASTLAAAGRDAGLRGEDAPFSPHVTLARLPTPTPLPAGTLDAIAAAAAAAPAFRAAKLSCYRSTITNKGARYHIIREFPLGTDGSAA